MITISVMTFLMLLPLSSSVSTANISPTSKAHGRYPTLVSPSGTMDRREGGREGGMEGGREGEGGERERGREGERERGREGESERGREGERERGRD